MSRFLDWVRWEFRRGIDITPFIRFIIIERFTKGTVLILGGIALIAFGTKTDIHQWAQNLQTQMELSPGRGWWRHLYELGVKDVARLSPREIHAVAAGAILYGLLEGFEGYGLLIRRRWAEYLVLLATGAFLPLEVDELIKKPTVFKAGALLLNIAIIVYLIWKKRLFLERRDQDAEAVAARPLRKEAESR